MSDCHCQVCWSDYSIDAFRRLACGHCFCISCVSTLQRGRQPVCPACRAPIAANGPQPIYLDLVATKPLARVVADGIALMDADSKLVSVRTAERKLRQVAKEQQERGEEAADLLGAIADFHERIVPLFAKARSQATEIAGLKEQVEEIPALRVQAERATGLAGEVAILRAEQVALRGEVRDANTQRDRERARAERAEVDARRAVAAEGEAQTDLKKLRGFLERAAEDRHVQKNKMKTLLREKDTLQQQLDDLRNEMRGMRGGASFTYDDDLEIEEEETFPSENSVHTSPHRSSAARPTPVLAFEGMPRPGFGSDWQLGRGTKRKERDETPSGFPIALSRGRTTVAVALGPKHSRRVKAR
ncbi:hypothetical protein B0H19DRAFT_1116255 [Mycena capillaripes]|nr:hypothetical protein B0H19DRAFT_1116255 [Mycena capillaripes]